MPLPEQPANPPIEGVLTNEGVECPALRADDGKLYTLMGDLRGFKPTRPRLRRAGLHRDDLLPAGHDGACGLDRVGALPGGPVGVRCARPPKDGACAVHMLGQRHRGRAQCAPAVMMAEERYSVIPGSGPAGELQMQPVPAGAGVGSGQKVSGVLQ